MIHTIWQKALWSTLTSKTSSRFCATMSSFVLCFLPTCNISLGAWSPRTQRWNPTRVGHNQTLHIQNGWKLGKINLPSSSWHSVCESQTWFNERTYMYSWGNPTITIVSLKVAGNFLLLLPQTWMHIEACSFVPLKLQLENLWASFLHTHSTHSLWRTTT